LAQDDLTGGAFTISNAGMLGLEMFTPIINYPQTAIMGVGAVMRLPRYLDDTSEIIVSRYIMKLCLSYDHRVIDGAPAARFSLRVRELLQNPEALVA
jgi:pyruvate dehydrogenase E2 component (dihydrolipoamide acetyltransferase)